LNRAHEAEGALLDEVEERQAATAIPLGDRHDEAKVGLDHLRLGGLVAGLDALGEVHLLRGREQRHAADVLQEELQRVGGLLDRGGPAGPVGLLGEVGRAARRLGRLEELDPRLVELLVDVLREAGIDAELVQHLGDVLDREEADVLAALQESAELAMVDEFRELRE